MKHLTFVAALFLIAILLPSCELQTNTPAPPPPGATNHMVINEIFFLPLTNQNTFRWIELYNPTSQPVSMRGWTFSFTTRRTTFTTDSAGNFTGFEVDSVDKYYDVPIAPRGSLTVPSNGFLTVVNDENRLENYTDYGPGEGPKIEAGNTLVVVDTVTADSIRFEQYEFIFRLADQFVLKDSLGNVVDVVRYGNYVYPGPGSDPYPNHRSIGFLPEYQSFARFSGAFDTDDTVNDFYVTGVQIPLTRPIPHWLSQAYKQ